MAFLLTVMISLLTACNGSPAAEENTVSPSAEALSQAQAAVFLSDSITDTYYEGQKDPAFDYFHNSSIQKFLSMWIKEEVKDLDTLILNYDSFTRISMTDHKLTDLCPEEELYCLTFTDGAGRYGYITVQYNPSDPSISNCGAAETTPYEYDLQANTAEISQSLNDAAIDLTTAKAARICLYDSDQKRADQAIRITDAQGTDYICFYGTPDYRVEKH